MSPRLSLSQLALLADVTEEEMQKVESVNSNGKAAAPTLLVSAKLAWRLPPGDCICLAKLAGDT